MKKSIFLRGKDALKWCVFPRISPLLAVLLVVSSFSCAKPASSGSQKRELFLESPLPVGSEKEGAKEGAPGGRASAPEGAPSTPEVSVKRPTSLVMGSYELAEVDPVIDGDSLRIPELAQDIRLFGVDCEEVFSDTEMAKLAEKDFDAYVARMQGSSTTPLTYPTPLGEEAKEFAQVFFAFGGKVRLEYDNLDHPTDYYGRHLVHLFYESHGQTIHYNLELVRRGYSPYYTKFGLSSRFDAEFQAAEEEARKQKLGIWAPGKGHYPDYDKRIAWWEKRALAIALFEARHRKDSRYIRLDDEDALARLKAMEGKSVVVFGAAHGIQDSKKPYKLLMAHRQGKDFAVISFDRDLFSAIKPRDFLGYYVYAEGTISLYRGAPQMKLEDGARLYQEALE